MDCHFCGKEAEKEVKAGYCGCTLQACKDCWERLLSGERMDDYHGFVWWVDEGVLFHAAEPTGMGAVGVPLTELEG